jgi:hypothetical protein
MLKSIASLALLMAAALSCVDAVNKDLKLTVTSKNEFLKEGDEIKVTLTRVDEQNPNLAYQQIKPFIEYFGSGTVSLDDFKSAPATVRNEEGGTVSGYKFSATVPALNKKQRKAKICVKDTRRTTWQKVRKTNILQCTDLLRIVHDEAHNHNIDVDRQVEMVDVSEKKTIFTLVPSFVKSNTGYSAAFSLKTARPVASIEATILFEGARQSLTVVQNMKASDQQKQLTNDFKVAFQTPETFPRRLRSLKICIRDRVKRTLFGCSPPIIINELGSPRRKKGNSAGSDRSSVNSEPSEIVEPHTPADGQGLERKESIMFKPHIPGAPSSDAAETVSKDVPETQLFEAYNPVASSSEPGPQTDAETGPHPQGSGRQSRRRFRPAPGI